MTADGCALGGGSAAAYCPSSPDYRRAAAAITRPARRRYAGHPALALWHVHNEYGVPVSECYCDDLGAQHFRRGCAAATATLDALNEAWGTAFWGQRYGDWEQIDAAATCARPSVNPAQRARLHALHLATHCSRTSSPSATSCTRVAPGIPVTTNFMAHQLQARRLLGLGAARSTSSPTTTT